MYKNGYLVLISSQCPFELWVMCRSSAMPDRKYWLTLHPLGAATCTCQDSIYCSGACKHLCVFRLLIETWGHGGNLATTYHFPLSLEEAIQIEEHNHCWYGPHLDHAITAPPCIPVEELFVREPLAHLEGPTLGVGLPPLSKAGQTDIVDYLECKAELQKAAEDKVKEGMAKEQDSIPVLSDHGSEVCTLCTRQY